MDKRLRQSEASVYAVIDSFLLGETAWFAYTLPLKQRISQLEPEMPDSQAIADLKTELKMLDRFDNHFSYMLMVLKKTH